MAAKRKVQKVGKTIKTKRGSPAGKAKGGFLIPLGTVGFKKDGTYDLETASETGTTVPGKRARRVAEGLLKAIRPDHANVVAFVIEPNGILTMFVSATAGKAPLHVRVAKDALAREMDAATKPEAPAEAAPEVEAPKKRRGRKPKVVEAAPSTEATPVESTEAAPVAVPEALPVVEAKPIEEVPASIPASTPADALLN